MKKPANKNQLMLAGLLLLPALTFAQEINAGSGTTYFSNALFNMLLVLIVVLLIVIIALGQALKNIAAGDFIPNKFKPKDKAGKPGSTAGVILLLLLGYKSHAANAEGSTDSWLIGGLDMFTFYSLLAVILAETLVIVLLYYTIMGFVKTEKAIAVKKVKAKSILETINASVDIDKEQEIVLGHEYDGIKELDNDLPPWWKYGFYLTIVVAVIYMINFHVAKTGDLQTAEYDKSMAKAKLEIAEYMKTAASNVDETTVKQLEGADLANGKDIFISNCAACHGKEGQGTVGPNLTDAYWLHGGGIADIFKSIKYGWVDKGMKSWKEDFSPTQIAQLASYIRTLNGSNPAGAKAAQGDLYTEAAAGLQDSADVTADTLTVKKDTLH